MFHKETRLARLSWQEPSEARDVAGVILRIWIVVKKPQIVNWVTFLGEGLTRPGSEIFKDMENLT